MPGQDYKEEDEQNSSLYSEPYDSIEYTYPFNNIHYANKQKSVVKDHIYESLENIIGHKPKQLCSPAPYANVVQDNDSTIVKFRRLSISEDIDKKKSPIEKKLKRRSVHFGSIFSPQQNSSPISSSSSSFYLGSEAKNKAQRKAAEVARNRRRSLILFPGKVFYNKRDFELLYPKGSVFCI